MPEEKEKQQAELIKHVKPPEEPKGKKKVIIKSKKKPKVVIKASKEKPGLTETKKEEAEPSATPATTSATTPSPSATTPSPSATTPSPSATTPSPSATTPSPQPSPTRVTTKPSSMPPPSIRETAAAERERRGQTPYTPRGDNRPKGRPYNNNRPGFGNNRPPQQENRDNRNTRGPFNRTDSRPGGAGGARDFRKQGPGGRPDTGRGKMGTPLPTPDQQKQSGRKVFRAKKDFRKEVQKEELESFKNFLAKKKTPPPKANPVPKEIDIMESVTISEMARKMNLKASDLIGKLMKMGMMLTINQAIDAETATLLADEFDCKVNIISLYDETIIDQDESEEEELEQRPPIVTIMGHVDHGKTKLLDMIRATDVVGGEHGGITQHIGAYSVHSQKGQITFLDTPGHEAFSMMRARGADVTDIVVLIVAANDGVMPQTVEALNHAKEAKVPIIVAINKMDLPDANPDRVMQQISDRDLVPEEWGGNVQFIKVSALKGDGIDALLDAILLEADMLELKASRNRQPEGTILEAKIEQGRGIVATVLVQKGTLKVGDAFVAGIYSGKVRAMYDDHGESVKDVPPATPVEVIGFSGVPGAGDPFQVVKSERIAKQFSTKRVELKRHEESQRVQKVTLDNLYDSIEAGAVEELKVIIKGDVFGSVEAIKTALEKLSTSEVRLSVIHAAAGAIVESDINLASASNAIIIGFHVRPTPRAQELADQEKVDIRKYNIIYEVVDDIRDVMEGRLKPIYRETNIGTVEIRAVFKISRLGQIAGCMVTSGKVTRKSQVHIERNGERIYTGPITSLKRHKDDAKEVKEGFECGIGVDGCEEIHEGDIFTVFEMEEVARKLESENTAKSDG